MTIKPYYQDNFATQFNGHVLNILPQLEPESIQCCVTSPPYWGLRDYGLPPQIWDDPGGCEHEWGQFEKPPHPGQVPDTIGAKAGPAQGQNSSSGQFCQLCGAWRGSLGLEPDPSLYIQHIVQVFQQVKRVLRKDGTLWLNMGDSYAGGGRGGDPKHLKGDNSAKATAPSLKKHNTIKAKDLIGIPWRVALALQADGWWLRSDNIWNKLNPMPESVNGWRWERHRLKIKNEPERTQAGKLEGMRKHSGYKIEGSEYEDCPGCPKCTPNDGFILRKGSWRPTRAHEYVFLLTKSDEYFADADAVREVSLHEHSPKTRTSRPDIDIHGGNQGTGKPIPNPAGGRNLRSVWTIATEPTPEAHFATFPEKLVIPCIKAGTSEKGCCPECGAPWVRVVEKESPPMEVFTQTKVKEDKGDLLYTPRKDGIKVGAGQKYQDWRDEHPAKTIGWKPSCECIGLNEGYDWMSEFLQPPIPCTVLDCFSGSGKVLTVAKKLFRKAIGIELNANYCEMPLKKLKPGRLAF